MKINAIKNVVTMPISDLEFIHYSLLRALAKIRLMNDKPLTPFESEIGPLTEFDFASISIIETGQKIGLDLGIESPHHHNQLDLSGNQ